MTSSRAPLARRCATWAAVTASGACVLAAVGFVVVSVATGGHRHSERKVPASREVAVPTTSPAPAPSTTPAPAIPVTPPGGVAIAPSLFQPGACRLFYPTRGYRHITVFLDAGHGGLDPGAVGQTESGQVVHEANLTLPVELEAAAALRNDGFTVVVSRTRNSLVGRLKPGDVSGKLLTPAGADADISARDHCADLAHAAALVGIYFDAGYSSYNAGSLTAYDQARPFWRDNLHLATLVQKDVISAMNAHGWGIPNDGVLQDSSLGGPPLDSRSAVYGHLMLIGPAVKGWFSTASDMPGALIEPLFVTDPFEATIAASATGQHVIAGGIARAVEQYFKAS